LSGIVDIGIMRRRKIDSETIPYHTLYMTMGVAERIVEKAD